MTFFFASVSGLFLSFCTVALLRPALPAPWRWAWQGKALHCGLWLLLHALLVLLLGRPWFAMAIGQAFLMLLVQVSNAKFHSLREPFVFQDFEYFTDAIHHPRLYIPFLGWWKFLMIVIAVAVALGVGLWLESTPEGRFSWDGQLGEVALVSSAALIMLLISGKIQKATYQPDADMRRLGFLGCLWCYGWAEQLPMKLPDSLLESADCWSERPDLVVVQSESFFDPRPLLPAIRPDILEEFDRLCVDAICHGRLLVPAWGANTVRSEFAFLSGAPESMLGVHRFNPYRQMLKAEVTSLARLLKSAGYRTICVHPYPASFYCRDKVYPFLGFDEFVDIRSFNGSEKSGPYISDEAVGDKVQGLLAAAEGPVFVFVITMENHGPLHLEKPLATEEVDFYADFPPPGCDDLTVYLRHLKNADRMMGGLRAFLETHARPARLCCYGDHVPIMSAVYQQLGDPDGQTEYLIWSNRPAEKVPNATLHLSSLAQTLLDSMDRLARNCQRGEFGAPGSRENRNRSGGLKS